MEKRTRRVTALSLVLTLTIATAAFARPTDGDPLWITAKQSAKRFLVWVYSKASPPLP